MAKDARTARILLVDDDPDFLGAMGFIFRKRNYQISLASNGNEAFALAQATPFDIIVSDIRMPNGDGIELLERMRSQMLQTPIILLVTGFTDITTELAQEKGAKALFSKPFNSKELDQVVHALLSAAGYDDDRSVRESGIEWKADLRFEGACDSLSGTAINPGLGRMFVDLPPGSYPNISDTVSFTLTGGESGKALAGNGVVRSIQVGEGAEKSIRCGIEVTAFSG